TRSERGARVLLHRKGLKHGEGDALPGVMTLRVSRLILRSAPVSRRETRLGVGRVPLGIAAARPVRGPAGVSHARGDVVAEGLAEERVVDLLELREEEVALHARRTDRVGGTF